MSFDQKKALNFSVIGQENKGFIMIADAIAASKMMRCKYVPDHVDCLRVVPIMQLFSAGQSVQKKETDGIASVVFFDHITGEKCAVLFPKIAIVRMNKEGLAKQFACSLKERRKELLRGGGFQLDLLAPAETQKSAKGRYVRFVFAYERLRDFQ